MSQSNKADLELIFGTAVGVKEFIFGLLGHHDQLSVAGLTLDHQLPKLSGSALKV